MVLYVVIRNENIDNLYFKFKQTHDSIWHMLHYLVSRQCCYKYTYNPKYQKKNYCRLLLWKVWVYELKKYLQ